MKKKKRRDLIPLLGVPKSWFRVARRSVSINRIEERRTSGRGRDPPGRCSDQRPCPSDQQSAFPLPDRLNWSNRCSITLDASSWRSETRNDSLPGEKRDRLGEFFGNVSDLHRSVTSIDVQWKVDVHVDEFDSEAKEKRVSRRRISCVHWFERDAPCQLFQRNLCWSRLDEVSCWMFIAEEHLQGDIVQSISDARMKVLFHSC